MNAIETIQLEVRGMTCEHCVQTVHAAVRGVAGVTNAVVDLQTGLATVEGQAAVDPAEIVAAVETAGYGAGVASESRPGAGPAIHPAAPGIGDPGFDADLIVIGGGSAGFAAAIAAHEAGARVFMINDGLIGGTCVNVGCVPSKALIRAAEAHHRARESRFEGVESSSRVVDFLAMREQKDELVSSLRRTKYRDVLEAYERIELIEGRAQFVSADAVEVAGRRYRGARFVIATGSRPWVPPIPGLREANPLSSTTAFELDHLPESMIVLGGRYIALEVAQLFARLGVRVTMLQRSAQLLPPEDEDVVAALTGYLRDESMTIETGVTIERVARDANGVRVHALVDGESRLFSAAEILSATGRRPITDGLDLEAAGVEVNADGSIRADDHLKTTTDSIYAAGDVAGAPEFVYTAAYEGRLAAENGFADAADRRERDYSVLPWVIFTDPQIAGVGHNEKSAALAGIEVDVATIALAHVPRALAARDTRGFVKLLRERGTDRLVGARVLAPEGGELIMEAALAIRYRIPVSELASAFHPYLTQSEAIKLCAQTFEKDVALMSCCA